MIRTSKSLMFELAAIAFCSVLFLFLHNWLSLSFPIKWGDETHFLIPSVSFSHGRGFDASAMLNPRGIYWMPPVMYLVNGASFAAFGDPTVEHARMVSCVLILAAGGFFYLLLKEKAGLPLAALISSLWLFSIPILFAANIARPEALSLFLLFLAAYLLLSCRANVATIAVSIVATLTHPLLSAPAMAAAGIALVHFKQSKVKRWEIVFLLVMLAAVGLEVFRFFSESDEYIRQFVYQVERKSGRGLNWQVFTVVAAIVCTYFGVIFRKFEAGGAKGEEGASLLLLGLSCLFVYIYGREMPYGSYLITGCALFSAALVVAMSNKVRYRKSVLVIALMLMPVISVSVYQLRAAIRGNFYGFSILPNIIASSRADQISLIREVASMLSPARPALVSPFVFFDFKGANVLTFNPLSTETPPANLGYFLTYTATYPSWLAQHTRKPPSYVLSGFRCSGVKTISRGRFSIEIQYIEKASNYGRDYEPCVSR